ncbi:MAG: hypothetical protein H6838_20510 [Planctomycetes bacterium]|nr:hypothetical protein [Planctomycetota bacterium]
MSSRRAATVAVLAAALAFPACSGSGGGSTGGATPGTAHAELQRIEFGRLADVYGYQVTPEGQSIALFARDVLIGPDIEDERGTNEVKRDDEILFDFIGSDPDTLQPRLFIPRDMTSNAFKTAFERLDDQVREVTPMVFGTSGPGRPFGVVPRNAAIRLVFSGDLGVDDAFFVNRDANGQVTGLRNTEAVQLLQIVGDPTQLGGFSPVPARIVVGARTLILDPVLLGTEGQQFQTANNAAGLPASPDQVGANIRVALALEGPLSMPSLREPTTTGLRGINNSGRAAIVRDFRSGNSNDNSADISRGFVRDALPLRIVGEIVMYLEAVDSVNEFTQEITVYKNGVSHEIDRGDVFRIVSDSSGIPFGAAEVVVDPDDDQGQPDVQHVRVRIRRLEGLENLDPRNIPGYPSNVAQREPWLVENAPKAICVAEFRAGTGPNNATPPGDGDNPEVFISFTPEPLPNLDGSKPDPNEFVSPYAGAVVRFTKPVDMSTVKWADTFFFAMRDLTSQSSIDDFIAHVPNNNNGQGMDPAQFNAAKFRTPYLVTARVFDEDGSQTALRLQPTSGFFLNDAMRNPAPNTDFRFFLHLIADSAEGGILDLAGNRVDLQGTTAALGNDVVIPFTVDTRMNGAQPFFPDNVSINIVRRFADRDEDAMPSYFQPSEVQAPGTPPTAASYPLEDLFGGFVYIDGKLQARPTSRVRVVADNLNQAPVGAQGTVLQWCPPSVSGEGQVASNSATQVVNAGIQNPLNPYGCRLQTLWREVDLSLSRSDPFDFNLDIEQMYWAPYTGTTLVFDEFDRASLFLGHSEFRPAPCVGDFSSLPSLPNSGLRTGFQKNFVWNPEPTGGGATIESQPSPHPAYVDAPLTIDPSTIVYEVNQVNRFLPLPTFQKPYFVYRDETMVEQGNDAGTGSDVTPGTYNPYILSPFEQGQGRRWVDLDAGVTFVNSFWNDAPNRQIATTSSADAFTGGLVGNVALPLLADFWAYCDSSELPAGNGYTALGVNGWQVSVTVQSSPVPNFRIVSAGRPPSPSGPAQCIGPGSSQWNSASGGWTPGGSTNPTATANADNTLYWIMMDVLKRQSVITNGFLDINNPNRVPEGYSDPRLGPFYLAGGVSTRPNDVVPVFGYEFDPPLSSLPGGTSVVPQFRAAGPVDGTPWYWQKWISTANALFPADPYNQQDARNQLKPTADNFPLDPYKAGDAHIRKWDSRPIPGTSTARNWWTYFYNRTVTSYVSDPNQLVDPAYTLQFAGPNETFTPADVRYVNWRFVTTNNTDAQPPVSPVIETFALSYRFQRVQ